MKKVIRSLLVMLVFIPVVYFQGVDARQAQEMFLLLGGMLVFSLFLDNIWLSMLMIWTIFSFILTGCKFGNNYLTNIFIGCVLYYCTKHSFKKEHIDFYLNAILWLVVANLIMMFLQLTGYDFMYQLVIRKQGVIEGYVNNFDPGGLMGYKAAMGCLMALAVPILASRTHKWAIPMSLLLFVPLYISKSSICVGGAVIALMFVLWYKIPKRIWVLTASAMVILATLYVVKVDMPMGTLTTRFSQWKNVMHDAKVYPITGWGLDSFRNVTDKKKHVYAMNPTIKDGKVTHADFWDNAHNLYIQGFFEFGLIFFVIIIGYGRDMATWFNRAVKEPNTLALAGFVLTFLIVSIAQFPIYLARLACVIIPMAALAEIQMRT